MLNKKLELARGVSTDVPLDTDILLERIGNHLGRKVKSMKPHGEGRHHKTLVVQLDDRSQRLIRIHCPASRQFGSGITPKSKMRSEIATIKYVRKYTMVPVPDVLAYDADEDGAVGGEWMIMEFVDGVPLDEVWRGMSNRNRYQVALSIAGCLARLIELRFSHIGSLYEDEGGFRVGAMTFLPSKNVFHTGAPVETQCGPFDSPKDWLLATARRRLEFTSKRELTQAQRARMNQVISDLLSDPALKLCGSSRMSAIALEHVDLGPSNILVDPANPDRVLAIIDWEGARTVPLWAIQPHPFGHLNKEEVSPKQKCALQHIIRHAIASQVPQWLFATGDEGRSFRVLLQMARKGTAPFDEEDFESRDQILRGLKV